MTTPKTAIERKTMTVEKLRAENAELRRRLEEAEETIRAIRSGAVDAFVVEEPAGHRVYTLEGADRPYRLLVEQMQQGAATLQADGTIVYCNLRLADLLKMSHEKLIGAALHDFIATDDRALYDNLLWQGRSRSGRGEARLRRADGALVPAYLTFNVLPKDCGAVIGVLITDLTAQRHHEQLTAVNNALRESEQRLRFVMDSMPQKIFTATPNGDVDYFNPIWTEFTGLTFEQIRDWGWTQFIHPDDLDENVRVWRHSIATGEPFQFEHRFRRADGEYRWHLSRALPMRDAAGRVLMWIGSNTEVHEQWQTANKLRQLAAELSDADRRKNEFLAMLAHELRNPLAPIRNALEILRLTGGGGEAAQPASEMMERQVGQMVRLVDDLLDVSRISRGKIELRKERIELASVVHYAVEVIRPLCKSMDHELTVTLAPQPMYLNADPARLAQVVGNLLNNACKFTERGGRIWLTVEREGGQAVIRVRDTGIGIAAGELSRIFEMFTQVDISLERTRSGLGIGLSLAKNLVEMHGGTVAAQSAGIGQGSEFVVRLPIMVEMPKPPPPEPTVSEPTPTTVRRILVVDDNRDSAESLATLLGLTGNKTHTAYDGLEAVEAAAAFKPDVVLLDIGLPKMNGFEAARKIRAGPWGKKMVLVALTGWGQEEDRQKSRDAGFDGHLVKPVDHAALTKLLAALGVG